MPLTPRLLGRWCHKCARPLVYVWLVLAFRPILPAQSVGSYLITTAAGLGNPLFNSGFSGDGGPALYAGLIPNGVATDNSGNLFIADGNSRIRKVTPQGTITTVAGTGSAGFSGDGGPATSAQLSDPSGVAVDASGNLFIADGISRIRKVTPQGTITTVAGTGSAGFSGDGGPATSAQVVAWAVAVDASGNLFIVDGANNRIRKVTPQGTITTVAGNGCLLPGSYTGCFSGDGGPAVAASLYSPYGVAVDASSNLFIADTGNQRIRKVTPQGTITTVAGTGTGYSGAGISAGFSGDGGPATSAQLSNPRGVAVDGSGNLFIADFCNNRIRKVTPQGTITTVAGSGGTDGCLVTYNGFTGDGGPATSAQLSYPSGAAVDASGNLFIPDGVIRQLVPSSTSTLGCVYSVDQSAQNFGPVGGTNNVGVLASGISCPWLAISYVDWISGVAGGTGSVTYTVSPNPDSASRAGTIWIAGNSLTVNQSGVVCSLSVSSRSVAVAPAGVTGSSLSVSANAPDCQWSSTASAPWILVSGGSTGTGSGTVTYTVGVNTGGLRTGTIMAAGQEIYVNQAAAGTSVSSLASINASGVVNAASFSPPISPGSFISIYGQNLADTTTDWSAAITNGKLPTSLAGVQVLINGKNAYIYYAQPTQVNAIAQPDTVTGSIEVDVITNHGTVPALVNMVPVSPGLFTYSLQGTLYAAALFNTDGAYVGAVGAIPGVTSRPAQAGDYLLLFATGLGQTNPPYPVGQVLTTAYPVPDLSKVSVLIGGNPASVLFAGMTYSGLFQINIQVPNGTPAGDQAIVVAVGGQESLPAVYLTFGGG